ncbi:alkaline phosphatase family protein [Virgisporangium aliadipatigenens]|uniref:Alkaline phosphatase family protein n=1 Tax=Virgisporangium aliadipatigenens TaxID=741659 RepID=A0A8J3YSM5_9ACTN|nr:nucleotide pyrophosphatase/phosphodiesterase family protein [Virgisporangium aliadipatigenens]GIJ49892.1 alkaline phosphatase family protein [Virgisporangium aliadipatigenens]
MNFYASGSLADVLPSALAVLGVPGSPDPLGLAAGLEGVNRVAVLLVDGLGWLQLPATAAFAPTLAGFASAPSSRGLTSAFPSTTPVSLVTAGTGVPPGAHGILGFNLRVPDTGTVLNHLRWTDEPDPARWQPVPTVFSRAAAAGIAASVVTRPEFAGSGLTVAAYRGAHFRGASHVDGLVTEMLGALGGTERALVYGYHPDVDRAGHQFGVDSPQWRAAVIEVDDLLRRLAEHLPPDAALLVTADHGQVDVPAGRRFDLDADPRLRAGVAQVAGEARLRYLHTVPGARDDVLAAWREILGPAAEVVTREEAVAAGWYGPVDPAHRERLGDVVAACRDDYVVLATATEPDTVTRMVAFHGSYTPVEMSIPLLVIR